MIHSGSSWGISIYLSANVDVLNTAVIGHYSVGVYSQQSSDTVIDGLFVGDIKENNYDFYLFADTEACISFCSQTIVQNDQNCQGSRIVNSIATGCKYAGFVVQGYTCDVTNSETFKNNVAHSIKGSGALVIPMLDDVNSKNCYEASDFSAYKCTEQGVATNFDSNEIRIHDMVFVDNQMGVTIQTGGIGAQRLMKMYNVSIYGESS